MWFDDRPGPGVSVDGGSAGADSVDNRPLRYRTSSPPWADQTLVELASRVGGPVILGAVRSTTAGIPNGVPFIHPFVTGQLAGTHNGWISGFRSDVARRLVSELSDDAFAELDGMSDSAVLFGLAADAYRAGADLVAAAREATDRAGKVVLSTGQSATLTLVLADHTGVAAVNAAVDRQANSLYVHDAGDHRFLASEPMDPGLPWQPIKPGAAVLLTPTRLDTNPS